MMLEKEFDFYIKNQDDLVDKYNERFIVIIGETVVGDYDSETQAFEATVKKHEPGTFLIQKCSPGEQSYTQTFYTRVYV